MSDFLIFNNIHLGLELLGAIVFFIISWLFFEAFLIKKDVFSLGRALGFLFLAFAGGLHAVYGGSEQLLALAPAINAAGLVVLILSFGFERLPPKPDGAALFMALPVFAAFLNKPIVAAVLSLFLAAILFKKYFVDIERLLKWLALGFLILGLASLFSMLIGGDFDRFWILEHGLRLVGFLTIIFWVWQWLSLRIREETLLVFIATSLFIVLLLTTTFSVFFLKKTEIDAKNNLALNAKVLNFYIESLKNQALSGAQIIARNDDLILAVRFKELAELEKTAQELLKSTNQQFLTVAQKDGGVLYRFNFPILSGENVLSESVVAEALSGKPAVDIERVEPEGFSVRAAAPIFDRGKVAGVVVSGFLLNNSFALNFKDLSKLETSIFVDKKVIASSLANLMNEPLNQPLIEDLVWGEGKEFVGAATLLNQEIIGAFLPIKSGEKNAGALSITTTPGDLLADAQATNRLTMFIIFLIVLALIAPLYRFTLFLTS